MIWNGIVAGLNRMGRGAPATRDIQYVAASRLNHERLGYWVIRSSPIVSRTDAG